MSSDSENRPVPPKRRRIKPMTNTDSSDDSDSSVLKPLRHSVVHKQTSSTEAAGTSHPVERGRRSVRLSNLASGPAESESVEPKRRSKASSKSGKSPKKPKEDEATNSKIGVESDVSNGQEEQCPICLIVFVNQEVASPCSCEHFFCFQCLMEWSKNTNTCPVDRKTFNVIDVRPKFGDKVERQIPVSVRTNMEEDHMDQEDEEDTDDDFHFRLGNHSFTAGVLRIGFPHNSLSSSSSSSTVLDILDISSDSLQYYSNTEEPSSPLVSEHTSSPAESEEPSSPSVINLLSSPSENGLSSPSEIRQLSSPSEDQQVSFPSDNEQCSSPSENQQFSSSPEDQQQYSSLEDSLSVSEQLASPSVKDDPSSPSVKDESTTPSEIEQYTFSDSEEERYSSSSGNEVSFPHSEDVKASDSDSCISSSSSY